MFSAWTGIALVLTALAGLIAVLRWYEAKWHPHPEVLRKLLHIVMGGVTVGLPWLFHDVWAVWVLAFISILLLALIKRWEPLRRRFASVVCSVNRETYGELCFPLAVAIVFTACRAEPLTYCISISILAMADALSALVGVFYGTHKYSTAGGSKTIEGSLCFFVVTALTTYAGLALCGTRPAVALAIAGLLGCLVTAFESIAWKGLDNLFIPLSAFALLKTSAHEPLPVLAERLALAVLLLTLAMYWRRCTTLDDGAALGAGLSCYVSWAVGGLPWLLPPLTAFLLYPLLMPRKFRRFTLHTHSIYEVVWVTSVGFLWLLLGKALDAPLLVLPYTLSYAIHTCLIWCAHTCLPQTSERYRHKVVLSLPLITTACFFLPALVLSPQGAAAIPVAVAAAALVYAGTSVFCRWYRAPGEPFSATSRWAKQTCVVALSSAGGLVPMLIR